MIEFEDFKEQRLKGWNGVQGGKYYLVNTLEQFEIFIKEAKKQRILAVDTETTGLDWVRAEVCGFVIGWGAENNFYLPINHKDQHGLPISDQLPFEEIYDDLKALLEDEGKVFFMWNGKYDLHMCRRHNLEILGVLHDGLISSFLMDENEDHSLKGQSKKFIDKKAAKWEKGLDTWRVEESKRRRKAFNEEVKQYVELRKKDPETMTELVEEIEKQIDELGVEDNQRKRKRNHLIKMYFKEEYKETTDSINKYNAKDDISYDFVPLDLMTPYACADTHYTWLLVKKYLYEVLDDAGFRDLYINEMALLIVLFEMEERGLKVDTDYLKKVIPEMTADIESAEQEIYDAFGRPFNIGANQELRDALLGKGINLWKLTKKGYEYKKKFKELSKAGMPLVIEDKNKNDKIIRMVTPEDLVPDFLAVDKEVMEYIASEHEFANKILEYKKLLKLRDTYAIPIYSKVDEFGFIHPSFNPNVRTGRMSSFNPNFQNIPGGDKRIKVAIINLGEDWVYVMIDYSQVELRVAAHLSQDPLLMACYPFEGDGIDVHSQTCANVIMHIDYEEVLERRADLSKHNNQDPTCLCWHCEVDKYRRIAKIVNFGILYGVGPRGLKTQASTPRYPLTEDQCALYIDNWLETYYGVARWLEERKRFVLANGYTKNIFGRYRRFPKIKYMNYGQKARAIRQATNFDVQGAAADLFKIALVRVANLLRGKKSHLVNVVHDDMQMYMHKSELDLLPKIIAEMEDFDLSVPIVVDVSYSTTNWAEKRELN